MHCVFHSEGRLTGVRLEDKGNNKEVKGERWQERKMWSEKISIKTRLSPTRKEKLSQVVNVYELQKAVAHPASLILGDFFFGRHSQLFLNFSSTFSQLSSTFSQPFLNFFQLLLKFCSTFAQLLLNFCSTFSQLLLNFFSAFLNLFLSTCELWHLILWLQYWQLRTWIHDNLCYLTINCDTGQHSQFLRCFKPLWE